MTTLITNIMKNVNMKYITILSTGLVLIATYSLIQLNTA